MSFEKTIMEKKKIRKMEVDIKIKNQNPFFFSPQIA